MSGYSRPDLYSQFISSLVNDEVYSPEAVARFGEKLNLLPADVTPETRNEYLRTATHAFVMRAGRKLREQVDAVDRNEPTLPRDAYLGIRWKTTISERYLSEEDQALVEQFRNDLDFRTEYCKTALNQRNFRPNFKLDFGSKLESAKTPLRPRFPKLPKRWMQCLIAFGLGMATMFFWSTQLNPYTKMAVLQRNGDIKGLRALLRDPGSLEKTTVIRAIADVQKRQDTPPVFLHLTSLDAVFAIPKQPFLLFGTHLLRLGDRVSIDNVSGVLLEINPTHAVIESQVGSVSISYPPLASFGAPRLFAMPITIYPRGNNLLSLLQAVGQEAGYQVALQTPIIGHVAGTFNCWTLDGFLDRLQLDLGLWIENNQLQFEDDEDQPIRTCAGFDGCLPYRETSVQAVLAEYETLFQIQLICESPKRDLPVGFPPTQLHEFMAHLALKPLSRGSSVIELVEKS